jgi:hypothetical protein
MTGPMIPHFWADELRGDFARFRAGDIAERRKAAKRVVWRQARADRRDPHPDPLPRAGEEDAGAPFPADYLCRLPGGPIDRRALGQNAFGKPASFRILLAVCLCLVSRGIANCLFEIGLDHISCEPLPCRTNSHPASRNIRTREG